MLFWLAHVLRLQERKDDSAALFCEASIAASNLHDFASAGRYGLWALRMKPESEDALRLAVDGYGNMAAQAGSTPGLALLVVGKYEEHQIDRKNARGWRGILLRECDRVVDSVKLLSEITVDSPAHAWILGELAQSLLLTGPAASDRALEAADRAVALSPEDRPCYGLRLACSSSAASSIKQWNAWLKWRDSRRDWKILRSN
jgi:hypothetical protein